MEAHLIRKRLAGIDPGKETGFDGGFDLLGQLSHSPELIRTLDGILADADWFSKVERDSYHHALGFKKFVLHNNGEAGQLRLHYWCPGSVRNVEHVHGHRFTFASTVIFGRMVTTLFQESPDGPNYRRYREEAAEAEREWRFVEVGEASLSACASFDMSAGDRYVLGSSNLHRAEVPLHVETATLLVQGPLERRWSPIYVASDVGAMPTAQEQVRFSSSELRQYLRHIRDLLEDDE